MRCQSVLQAAGFKEYARKFKVKSLAPFLYENNTSKIDMKFFKKKLIPFLTTNVKC